MGKVLYLMEKIDRSYIRYIRYSIQWGIVVFLVYAGYAFSRFVDFYAAGGTGVSHAIRPPSVEGFLPIGALMALKLWIATGTFDTVHPAGLGIFVSSLLTAFLLKKSENTKRIPSVTAVAVVIFVKK